MRKLFLIGGLVAALAACAPRSAPPVTPAVGLIQNAKVAGAPDTGITLADERSAAPFAQGEQSAQQRVVLKNASLTLVVTDAEAEITRIGSMAAEMGGWVVTSNSSKVTSSTGDEVTQGTITVRVPADRLDEALAQIKAGAVSVENENVNGQDVTQDYVDLTSQVNNLKAAETQLQTIMEQARTTEDVLQVYNELVRVRGEIETAQGRLRYYDEAATFSSISVNLIPDLPEKPAVQPASWNPVTVAETAFNVLVNILQFLASALIVIVIIGIPLALLLGVPAWFIRRTLQQRRERSG